MCETCDDVGWLCAHSEKPADFKRGACCGSGSCPSANGCPDCITDRPWLAERKVIRR